MSRHTPGPWTWRNQDGKPIDLSTWQSSGYYNNLQLCGPAFRSSGEAEETWVEVDDEIIGCDEYNIIRGLYNLSDKRAQAEANARLIAAAPELLEACIQAELQIEYMQSKFKETGTGNAVRAQLQAAIAKAGGK